MANLRRVARELALKALFQEDVGKQPPDEVLDGVLDQVRAIVHGPVTQATQEGQVALRRLGTELAAGASSQGSRQIKTAATACGTELRALRTHIFEVAATVIAAVPTADADTAKPALAAVVQQARAGLRRIAARETTYREALAQLAESADAHVDRAQGAFQDHIRQAAQLAGLTSDLVRGTRAHQDEIDRRLDELATGWRLERQAAVDRNIMRLAAYEVLYRPETPAPAAINEAVELAKKYSTAESGRFVNGVLGALAARARPDQIAR